MKYTKQDLLEVLVSKEATVTFTKKDGEKRVMRCTLKDDITPILAGTGKPKPDHLLAVWDLDKEGWRSITVDNVENVEWV